MSFGKVDINVLDGKLDKSAPGYEENAQAMGKLMEEFNQTVSAASLGTASPLSSTLPHPPPSPLPWTQPTQTITTFNVYVWEMQHCDRRERESPFTSHQQEEAVSSRPCQQTNRSWVCGWDCVGGMLKIHFIVIWYYLVSLCFCPIVFIHFWCLDHLF